MTWTCSKCGGSNADTTRICGDCGHVDYYRLVLLGVSTSNRRAFTIDTPMTDRLLQALVGDDARFASPLQFTLRREAATGGWMLSHESAATNPTFVNGAPVVAGEIALNAGDAISIGPKRAKLSVVLERDGG